MQVIINRFNIAEGGPSLHFLFTFLVGVFFFINLGLFLGMWLTACFWASGNGTCDLTESFSEMMANDTRVQQWFLAWWGIYTMVCLVLLILVAFYKIHRNFRAKPDPKRWCRCGYLVTRGAYYVIVAFYGIFTIVKLTFLPLVLFFPVTTQTQTHYLVAGFAFGAGILCSFVLLVRRMILRVTLEMTHFPLWLLIIDVIFVLFQLAMAITFLVVDNGVYEFLLALFIVIDTFFQICDFYFDKDPLEHIGIDTRPLIDTNSALY